MSCNANRVGETDIAFTHSFALKKDEKVRFKYISEYTMHLAMSKKHPLAAYDTPQPDKLSEQTFYIVAQQDEAASKERLIRLCHKIGFTPKRIELLDNFPTLINVLRETSGEVYVHASPLLTRKTTSGIIR